MQQHLGLAGLARCLKILRSCANDGFVDVEGVFATLDLEARVSSNLEQADEASMRKEWDKD